MSDISIFTDVLDENTDDVAAADDATKTILRSIIVNKKALMLGKTENLNRTINPMILAVDVDEDGLIVYSGKRRRESARNKAKRRKIDPVDVIERLVDSDPEEFSKFAPHFSSNIRLEECYHPRYIPVLETVIRIIQSRRKNIRFNKKNSISFLYSQIPIYVDSEDSDSNSESDGSSGYESSMDFSVADTENSRNAGRHRSTRPPIIYPRYNSSFEALLVTITPEIMDMMASFVMDEIRFMAFIGARPSIFIDALAKCMPEIKNRYAGLIQSIVGPSIYAYVNHSQPGLTFTSYLHSLAYNGTPDILSEAKVYIDPKNLLVSSHTDYGNISPLWVSVAAGNKAAFETFLYVLKDYLVTGLYGTLEARFFAYFATMSRTSVTEIYSEEIDIIQNMPVLDDRHPDQIPGNIKAKAFPVAGKLGIYVKNIIIEALSLGIRMSLPKITEGAFIERETTGKPFYVYDVDVESFVSATELSPEIIEEQKKRKILDTALDFLGDSLVYDEGTMFNSYEESGTPQTIGNYLVARNTDDADEIEEALADSGPYPAEPLGEGYTPYLPTAPPQIGIADLDFVFEILGRVYFRAYPRIHPKFVSDPYNFASPIILE